MSATAGISVGASAAPARHATPRSHNAFAGYLTLLAFMLRRDWVRLPAWVLGVVGMSAYCAAAMRIVFPNPEDLQMIQALGANPGSAMLIGPGFGAHQPSVQLFLGSAYGIYLYVGAALMSILTVSRHTRVEEQTGRAELIRANVVGRFAPLTASLTISAAMNVLVAVLVGPLLIGMGYDPSGAVVFGAAIGAAGLAFAGITATTVQLTAFSRTGSGIAGAILGASFLIRGLGDMSTAQGGKLGWLSWLSPIGWSQKAEPFGDNVWTPLLGSLVCFVAFAGLAYLLQTRRDLGAGLFSARRGSARAAAWLSGPLTLAVRLQMASILGWSVALFIGAFAYGGFTKSVIDGFQNAPQEVLIIIGGQDNLLAGYLGLMGILIAYPVAVFVILSLQTLIAEETTGLAEPVLATAVGRMRWMGSWVAVTAIGAVILQVVAGLGSAAGTAASMQSSELFGKILLAHVVHIPEVWVFLALASLLYAVRPRLVGITWALFGYSFLVGFFGSVMNVPDWAMKISPFDYVGRYPAQEISWASVALLSAIAVGVVAVGLVVFRRRDLRVG